MDPAPRNENESEPSIGSRGIVDRASSESTARKYDPETHRRDQTHRASRMQASALDGPVVLIVEDDAKLAGLIARMLRRAGFEPVVADTGDAALLAMLHRPPDGAVVDIMIPHPDGIEVCRQFRRDGWKGPIVAISALNSPEHRARATAAGADTFLAKPFPLAELVTTLEGIHGRAHVPL